MSDERDATFDRWVNRLNAVIAQPPGPDRDDAWKQALQDMWDDDQSLVVHLYNPRCIDGCCGQELTLSRIENGPVSPAWMVTVFPELIRHHATRQATLTEPDDAPFGT